MPVAKNLGNKTSDEMKSEEGNDSLDTLIRAVGKQEPLFPVSRTTDSSTQWIQLLHPFEQQDFPGWPLLAPMKVQMQKCDKCSREFCSHINYRRHMRVHRRSMNFHKEPKNYRDLLGAFWDKLTYAEAKEVMSFKDVNLEEVPGSTIVRHIATSLRKPFLSLPQVYMKAGSVLVDIIQGRPYGLPISSQDLFSVLDDASERTFLCAGSAESLQKYVFDGDAGKIGLEMKNMIACTSFLVEQKLVKAWLADKDAEAWKCQKLLVEEEEAAQRRQAEILERKRQRKIRQKARNRSNGLKIDVAESITSTETSSPQISLEIDPVVADEDVVSDSPINLQFSTTEEVFNFEANGGCSSDHSDSATDEKQQKVQGKGSRHFTARWQVAKSQKGSRENLPSNHNGNVIKWEQTHKHREQRVNNGGKIWTKKPKPKNIGEVKSRVNHDANNQTQPAQSNYQLIIGSISVTVKNSQTKFQENGNTENKTKSIQNVKLSRLRLETSGQSAIGNYSQTLEESTTSGRKFDQTLSTENGQQACDLNGNHSEGTNDSNVQVEDEKTTDCMPFSVDAAKAFLSQRWKEAISGNHVELVLTSPPKPPGQLNIQEEVRPKGQVAEIDSLINANVKKPKFRTKPEKSIKTKYIPKQRAVY